MKYTDAPDRQRPRSPLLNKVQNRGEHGRVLTLVATLFGVFGCSGDRADARTSATASRDANTSAPDTQAPQLEQSIQGLAKTGKLGKIGTPAKPVAEVLAEHSRAVELDVPPTAAGPTTVAALRDEPSVQPLLQRIEALGGELALDRDRVMSKRVPLQVRTLLATDWKNRRFSGNFAAGTATGLVMVERELAVDVGYGVRLAYSDDGMYKYFVKLEDAEQASQPVYRFRTSDGDLNVMGVVELEEVASSLMEFLDRLRAEAR